MRRAVLLPPKLGHFCRRAGGGVCGIAIFAVMNRLFDRVLVSLGVLLLSIWLVVLALTQPLNHDEHQFLASGWLMAQGLWPWRDFPLFQMPLLVALYGLWACVSDWLLLGGRLLAALAAAIALGWVWWRARWLWGARGGGVVATALVAMLAVHPQVVYAAGKAWNHSVGLLFACLAVEAWLAAGRQPRAWHWPFLGGVALALAAGVRLTFAVLGLPLLWAWGHRRYRWGAWGWWLAGGLVGLLPLSLFVLAAPVQCFDQTVRFHSLVDTSYFRALGGAMGASQRLAYALDLLGANYYLPFSAGALLAGLPVFWWRKHRAVWLSCVGVALALLWAALQKVVVFVQYFYAPLPFLALALACGLAAFAERHKKWVVRVVVCVAAVMVWNQRSALEAFAKWNRPEEWTPVRLHRQAQQWMRVADADTVLTLSPLYALEGARAIYPAFAASPFAWRTARHWPPAMRARNGIVGPDQLSAFAQAHGIRAVLTGFEPGIEDALDDWAEARGLTPVMPDAHGVLLWLDRPLARVRTADSVAGPLPLEGVWGPAIRHELDSCGVPLWLQAELEVRIPEVRPSREWLLVLELRRGDELLLWRARRLWPFVMAPGRWQRLWLASVFEGPCTGAELKAYLWRPQGGAPTQVRRFALRMAAMSE